MVELPGPASISKSQTQNGHTGKQIRRILIHCLRVLLFVSILLMIRFSNRQTEFVDSELSKNAVAIEFAQSVFPGAKRIGAFDDSLGGNIVEGENEQLGFVLQTSPDSDHIIGYSGPTNCLIAIDPQNKIQSVAILSSADTVDHVEIVREYDLFLSSFAGLGFETTDQWQELDAVSGATLTSYSVIASVANRMSGSAPSLKFKSTPDLENVVELFSGAASIKANDQKSVWDVFDDDGSRLGFVLTTTPVADHLSGYQGPTATLAGFDDQGLCLGILVDQSYENAPYATYLNDEASFQNFFVGKTLEEISKMVPRTLGIEGVSGATMTSLCVADGLPLAAEAALKVQTPNQIKPAVTRSWNSYWADWVTVGLTLIGVAFSFTKISRLKWFRLVYQIGVIVLLGFVSGHMLSQALLAGWSAHSVPWSVAPGLVFLTVAAFLIPIVSKHQPYCQHVCPFGALQQIGRSNFIKSRLPQLKFSQRLSWWLEWIPFLLLSWVVIVSISGLTFNLAGIEPFDGFGFRVAGWATIGIFVFGMIVSLFSPMAYCRFGCPTGAALGFLKYRADSDRLGIRDLGAGALVAIAVVMLLQ